MGEPPLDLSIALSRLHELAEQDGDLGWEYWNAVSKLLKSADGLSARIRELERELAAL